MQNGKDNSLQISDFLSDCQHANQSKRQPEVQEFLHDTRTNITGPAAFPRADSYFPKIFTS